jgi:hypothetical protein
MRAVIAVGIERVSFLDVHVTIKFHADVNRLKPRLRSAALQQRNPNATRL